MSHQRIALAASLFLTLATLPAAAQNQTWIRQLGTNADDFTYGAAPDGSGGVYVGGETDGSLAAPNAGAEDAWVARYDSVGNQRWIRQIGTNNVDYTCGLASDGSSGVFAAGRSYGSLGGPNAGAVDPWLARYDGLGNQLWILQFGTSSGDYLDTVVPDGTGGAFLTGHTLGSLGGPNAGSYDAWLARYDGAGNQLWLIQLGTAGDDRAYVSALDPSGEFFTGGITSGNLGGPHAGNYDAWAARYDNAGNQIWIRQLGTSADDRTYVTAIDGSGGVYFGGWSGGSLGGPNAGGLDAWLALYDGAGSQQWIRQFGTSAEDNAYTAAPGASGGIFVGGWTAGSFGGTHAGNNDAWLARYDNTGNRVWTRQLGTSAEEVAQGAAPDGLGGVFVGGRTGGSLAAPSKGGLDAWVAHYESSSPTPVVYCTAKVNSLGCTPAISMSNVPSVSAGAGCALTTVNVVAKKYGLFFHSTLGGQALPFHGGLLCVMTPKRHHFVLNSGGAAGTCNGVLTEDFATYLAGGYDPALGAGAQVWLQSWSRDPADPFFDGLSDAVTATLCP